MKIYKFNTYLKYFIIFLAITLVCYVIWKNVAPLGTTMAYYSGQDKNISAIGPAQRVEKIDLQGKTAFKQIDDLVYFTTQMPFSFDSAKIKITYENNNSEQLLYLGFQDQDQWHYSTQLIDSPIMNSINFNCLGSGISLCQKYTNYQSINGLLSSPPQNKLIGTFNLDNELINNSNTKLNDYSPSTEDTIISIPFRGKTIFYVYLENEPFYLDIQKQDLNWYEGEDEVTVSVYKNNHMLFSAAGSDDGVTDNSKKIKRPQDIVIQNPEKQNLENGVYKVVIDASADTIIRSIRTNLHKIVFESPIYLANNSSVYPGVIGNTKPTEVYTNSNQIKAITVHAPGLQTISIEDPNIKTSITKKVKRKKVTSLENKIISLQLSNLKQEVFATSSASISTSSANLRKITIPQNDVTLSAVPGYFAFSANQYFLPTPFLIIPIKTQSDIDNVNYILSDYNKPQKQGNWNVAETEFDLSNAQVKNGKLSWLIKAPGLKENNREIIIKDIQIELIKKPSVNLPIKLF